MEVRVLIESEIRQLIDRAGALEAMRSAFSAQGRGQAILPPPLELDIPTSEAEVHVKGACLLDRAYFGFKVSTAFYNNAAHHLPITGGLSMAFDRVTGVLVGLLFDNGWLTEIRTGAAGALAADLLATQQPAQVGIIGTGGQARHQLEALLEVRTPTRIVAYGRTRQHALDYRDDMRRRCDVEVELVEDPKDAVQGSQIVVTTTPSREPVVWAEWVGPGTHITAMGSDLPDRQELDPKVLAAADLVVADSLEQCLRSGEIHHAVEAGLMTRDNVYAELGEIASGQKKGRQSDHEVSVADLTGVGIQDAAIAEEVMKRAIAERVGQVIET